MLVLFGGRIVNAETVGEDKSIANKSLKKFSVWDFLFTNNKKSEKEKKMEE